MKYTGETDFMKSVTVLITSAGLATAVNVIHALRQATSFCVSIIAVDMNPLSAGLFLADKYYNVPPVSDPLYVDALIGICTKEKVDFLFPLFSGEIGIIADNIEKFTRNSVRVMLPTPQVINICTDKMLFLHFLNENRYSYPKTFRREEVDDSCLPLFIKPVKGSSSKNTFKINDIKAFDFYLTQYPNSIIQKFIFGVEYTVDCLVHDGKIYACSPRSRLNVKDGKSMVGKTVYHPAIESLVTDLLLKIGMNGPCNVQCIEDENKNLYLIEINPRLAAGGLPLTVRAGANIPEMMLKIAMGMAVEQMKQIASDVVMIRYLSDIFLKENITGYQKI